LSGGLSLF